MFIGVSSRLWCGLLFLLNPTFSNRIVITILAMYKVCIVMSEFVFNFVLMIYT